MGMRLQRVLADIGYFCGVPLAALCKMTGRRAQRARRNAASALAQAIQPLEPRMLMTTLYWAPNNNPGTSTYSMGGSGTWDITNFVWNTQADGHGTQRSWIGGGIYGSEGSAAVFGTTAGSVMLTGNLYSGTPLPISFVADGYYVNNSSPGALGYVTVNVDSDMTATLDAMISTGAITKTGGGTLKIDEYTPFNGVDVQAGTLELDDTHNVFGVVTVDEGAYLRLGGNLNLVGYIVNEGNIDVDGGTLTLSGSGYSGTVMFNSGSINVFDEGEILVHSNFLNTGSGMIQPHDDGLFRLYDGALLTNESSVYMGVYGAPEHGGKFQIDDGASVDNDGIIYIYSDGEVEINGDMTITANGTLEITNGGTGTIGESGTVTLDGGQLKVGPNGQLTNAGDITLENDGSILIGGGDEEFNDDAVLTNTGTLNFNSGTVTLAGSTEDGEGIASLENNGQMNLSSGASITIEAKGTIEQGEAGILNQSGGVFEVLEGGAFSNAGTISVSDGEFNNAGYICEYTNDLAVIDAIDDYGENTGQVSLAGDDVDLSGITLEGGRYSILGTATNDGGLVVASGTMLLNQGRLNWNDVWDEFERVVNYGDLYSSSVHQMHWFDDDESWRGSFTSIFAASGEATTDNGSTFDIDLEGGESPLNGELNQGSNGFSLVYDADTDIVTLNIAGQVWTKEEVVWTGEGEDALFFTLNIGGEYPEASSALLRDIVLTPDGESAIELGDRAAFSYDDRGRITLGIYGANLRDGFEMTAALDAEFDEDSTFDFDIEGGTFPIAAGPKYAIDPTVNADLSKKGTLYVQPGQTSENSLEITVTNNETHVDDGVEIIAESPIAGVTLTVGNPGPGGKRLVTVTVPGTVAPGTWFDIPIHASTDKVASAVIRVYVKP